MDPGRSKELVWSLYKALAAADVKALNLVLSKELDWCFHGPPLEQHLMRMITGVDRLGAFSFRPRRMDVIGVDKVIVEGHGSAGDSVLCWVHVWTTAENRVTHLREYCNTSVTVFNSPTLLKEFGTADSRCSKRLPGLVLVI